MSAVTAARFAQETTRSLTRTVRGEGSHILLCDLPRTTLPADIRRACAHLKVENIDNVALDYYNFTPTGRAWVTVTDPKFLNSALKGLNKVHIGGGYIYSYEAAPNALTMKPTRSRGVQGRAEAVERGLVLGNGPDGGVTHQGRNVVMYGLPGRMTTVALREHLKAFKLAGSEGGQMEIVKLLAQKKNALTSRHFIRMASVSEAHRLVRRMHMTYYNQQTYGTRYPIHAHVVY